jgi:hypothetical protein
MLKTLRIRICVFVLLLSVSSQAYSQSNCGSDFSAVLLANIDIMARDVVAEKSSIGPVNANFNTVLFYAIAEGVAPSRKDGVFTLEAYEYIGETARTDKQIGASARSGGSTSASEKPGFAELLGIAMERGAIQQQVNETSLTLSTTPYAFIAWANGADTATLYRKNEFFNRLGLSATFNLSNQEQVLANVNKNQLTEWSLRFRLFGDRSPRSKKFQQFWATNIRPEIVKRLKTLTGAMKVTFAAPFDSTFRDATRSEVQAAVKEYLDANSTRLADPQQYETLVEAVKSIIACKVKELVTDKIREGKIAVPDDLKTKINNDLIPMQAAANASIEKARADFNQFWHMFKRGPLTTVAYTNHRTSLGSDYSEFKFLHEQSTFSPIKINVNVWVSIYSNPNRALQQEQVRDYGASLAFEGETNSPFLKDTPELSKMTFAFTGRYQRMKENERIPGMKADIAVAQFKVEIPIRVGVSIPISATYANATELVKEKHVRGNFGLTFDVDKLFALTRRALNP